ncbi:MAG: PRC-barrel domain containing protein [Hyphomicrobiales bacterium]|nr:MAG: PRC-barrel domain containing protein [Hyphomicrobiales bacterium]
MKAMLGLSVAALLLATPAFAQTTTPGTTAADSKAVSTIPAQSMALSDWYKQSVYDNGNNKIGDINDVLIDQQQKASLAVIGVGGFLGIGEKNVAVPFDNIKRTVRDGKVYLTMDANKDALKAAQGLRYDRVTNSWAPDTGNNSSNTNHNTTTK